MKDLWNRDGKRVLPANRSSTKPFYVVALLILLGLILTVVFKLEPHHLSSKEAFTGNLYRGKFLSFIRDHDKAKQYLTQAVEHYNTTEAKCDIGEIYAQENNYKRAAAYYLMGARDGSHRCETNFLNLSFPGNEEEIFQLLRNMADEIRSPSAQYMVGIRFINGVGVTKNPEEGIAYLEKAVVQGHRAASVYLAGIYLKGELVPQDIGKANELMRIRKDQ